MVVVKLGFSHDFTKHHTSKLLILLHMSKVNREKGNCVAKESWEECLKSDSALK